jgi:hypothetical protein
LTFQFALSLTSSASKQHILSVLVERSKTPLTPRLAEASQEVGDVLTDWLKRTENQNKQRWITAAVHPARLSLIVADMPHTSAKIAPVEI